MVLVLNKVVVKLPNFTCQWSHFLKGLLANMAERDTWNWNENKSLMCPVLWCSWGGWLLIMKRAQTCEWEESIDYEIWRKAHLAGDDKPDNYGYLNGNIVKLDYGQIN